MFEENEFQEIDTIILATGFKLISIYLMKKLIEIMGFCQKKR